MKKYYLARNITRVIGISLITAGLVFLNIMKVDLFAAEKFPNKPILNIAPFSAGGGTDIHARTALPFLEKTLGTSVIIENVVGGAGSIGLRKLLKAKPDGYTIAETTSNICFYKEMGIADLSLEDFTPIVGRVFEPYILVVRSDSPWKTLGDIVESAQKKPDSLTMGSMSIGSTAGLVNLGFQSATKTKFRNIEQGSSVGQSVLALLGGHVDAVPAATTDGGIPQHLRKGTLRALAVFSEKRLASLPNVPTAKEEGINFTGGVFRGILAPPNTPLERVQTIYSAYHQLFQTNEYQDLVYNTGATLLDLNPQQFGNYVKSQSKGFLEVIEKAGLLKK